MAAQTTYLTYRVWAITFCGLTFLGATGAAIAQAFGR